MTPCAWLRRNVRHEGPERRGAGGISWRFSSERTDVAENLQPKLSKLADDAPIAPAWVLAREPEDKRLEFCIERRATRAATIVGPMTSQQPAMPAQ